MFQLCLMTNSTGPSATPVLASVSVPTQVPAKFGLKARNASFRSNHVACPEPGPSLIGSNTRITAQRPRSAGAGVHALGLSAQPISPPPIEEAGSEKAE